MKTLILVFLSLLISQVYGGSGSAIVELQWSGGHCRVCGAPGDIRNYACSNGYGVWNNGIRTFVDPIPENHILTGIDAVLYGVWGCGRQTTNFSAELNVTLQGTELDVIDTMGTCVCNTCDDPVFLSWNGTGVCFPDYNYLQLTNSSNILQVNVESGRICLDRIILELFYEDGDQSLCGDFLPSCDDFGGCGPNGECVIDTVEMTATCDCDPEWHGPNCQCNIPSYHLETTDPPVLDGDRSGFTADTLTLYVNNSAKYFDEKITFKNSLNNTCDYPQASDGVVWNKYFDPVDCVNTFEGIIPWSVAWPICVFDREEDPNWIVFTGEMIVENKEDVGFLDPRPINIIRTIESRLRFQVRFPRRVELEGRITGFSDLLTLASITEQIFESSETSPPGEGKVKLLTSVQYPFQLTNPVVIDGDGSKFVLGVTGDANIGLDECQDDSSESCEQYWDILVTPHLNVCDLDGNYTFSFGITCQPSFSGQCPFDSGVIAGTIDFILDSEDFCAQIIEDIDLSGFLATYSDSAHSVPQTSFFLDEDVHVTTFVQSTEATIIENTLTKIQVGLWNGDIVTLYDGAMTGDGLATSLTLEPSTATESRFHFVLDETVFPLGIDQNEIIEIFVVVDVKFQNTDAKRNVGFTSRGVSGDSKNQEFRSTIETSITRRDDTLSESSSNRLSSYITL